MKKKGLIFGVVIPLSVIFIVLGIILTVAGCNKIHEAYNDKKDNISEEIQEGKDNDGAGEEEYSNEGKENDKDDGNDSDYVTYTKDFGSYSVIKTWPENAKHSSNSKFFYAKEGTENDLRPNNISVNVGTNKYSSEEHMNFKDAILRQLSMQMGNSKGTTLNANGSHTENGYVVYTFIIKNESDNSITTQYYIVGDYKFALVHETTFGDPDECDKVAKDIVDSFKWDE